MKETPFYLLYGKQARTIQKNMIENNITNVGDVHAYASELTLRLSEVHQRVREILQQTNNERKELNDEKDKYDYDNYMNVGDKVLLHDSMTGPSLSRKLVRRWTGPFTVITKNSQTTRTIMKQGKTQLVNIERLRKYNENDNDDDNIARYELESAQNEVAALNDTIRDMQERMTIIENEQKNMTLSEINHDKNETSHDENISVEYALACHIINF